MPNRSRFTPAKEQILARAQGTTRYKDLSTDIPDADYGMLLMFRDYKYKRSDERGFSQLDASNVTDTIFLPLPAQIQDKMDVKVARFDQGNFGEVMSSLLSEIDINELGVSNITQAVIKGAQKNMPGLQGGNLSEIASSLDQDLAFLLRKGVDDLVPNQGRNIDAGTGTFINPKSALAFEGVEMKTHSFDWTISPKSSKESEDLRLIIETIKKNMLPAYVNTNVIQRAMLRYPSMVDIFFVGIDSDYYFHFKTCMIQGFSTNFTPNGMTVLRGGRPATVQMTMNVIESDIHTSEDYGGTGETVRSGPIVASGG